MYWPVFLVFFKPRWGVDIFRGVNKSKSLGNVMNCPENQQFFFKPGGGVDILGVKILSLGNFMNCRENR